MQRLARLPAALALLAACGEDEPPPPPTILELTIRDASSHMPIAGAEVLLPERHTTGADGKISVELPAGARRFRVEAPGYVSSPEPFAADNAVSVAANVTTRAELELEPRPGAGGAGRISGKVTKDGAPVEGALVLAAATVSASGLTDAEGRFEILGLAPNLYRVEAFLRGHKSTVKNNVQVQDAEVDGNDLELSVDGGAGLGGALGEGSGSSSVALALEATGDVVPGMIAKSSFGASYALAGIAPGRYRVRAALERDGRVLSPEAARMSPLVLEVTDGRALTLDLPTAPAIEGLSVRTGSAAADPVRISWGAVPDAGFYVVEVSNLAGQVIWGGFDARKQPNLRVLAPDTGVDFGALVPPLSQLIPLAAYRVRVYAGRDVPERATFELIAASEELDGRFRAAAR